MFYMKHRGKRLNIREDNVYTRCPNCGKEHAVDIQEIFRDGESDIYGTAVYCEDCAVKRVKECFT